MKYILFITIAGSTCLAQNGRIFETYKTSSWSTNQSDGTIFPKPFQEYNYIQTHRGIEIYETYKTRSYDTNQSRGTIFSKPFPRYIIINDKIYETYRTRTYSTNESKGTIFTKPFESKQIFNVTNTSKNTKNINIKYEIKYSEPLPRYNGEGEINYGE